MITSTYLKSRIMIIGEEAMTSGNYKKGMKQCQAIMSEAQQMIMSYSRFIEDYYKSKQDKEGQPFQEYIESLERRRKVYKDILENASQQYNRLSTLTLQRQASNK